MGFHRRVTAPRGHVRAPGATPSRPYFRSRRKLSLPDAANRFRPPPEVRPPPSMSLEAARGRRVPFLLSPGSVQNGSGPRAAAVLREVTARRAPPAAAVVRSRLCARPRGCGPPRHVPLPAGGPAEPRGAVGQRSAVVSTGPGRRGAGRPGAHPLPAEGGGGWATTPPPSPPPRSQAARQGPVRPSREPPARYGPAALLPPSAGPGPERGEATTHGAGRPPRGAVLGRPRGGAGNGRAARPSRLSRLRPLGASTGRWRGVCGEDGSG